MLRPVLLILSASILQLVLGISFQGQEKQVPLSSHPSQDVSNAGHVVDREVTTALKKHTDPVDALLSLRPELATELAEKRLIHIFGDEKPEWMTEGDKMRLRRRGKRFADITDHEDFYASQQADTSAGKASARSLIIHFEVVLFTLCRSAKPDTPTPHQALIPTYLNG